MRVLVLFVTLALLASPAAAGLSGHGEFLLAASTGDKKSDPPPSGGKVIIKGKGGKVTDVEQKPKKNDKKKSQ